MDTLYAPFQMANSGGLPLDPNGGPAPAPAVPSFRAIDSSTAAGGHLTSVPDSTFQKVAFNQLQRQDAPGAGGWNAALNRYVAPVAGTYLVVGGAEFSPGTNNTAGVFYLMAYVNGARFADLFIQGATVSGGNIYGGSGCTEITLTAGDYVELFTWHNCGFNSTLYQATYRGGFSARLITSI